MGKMGLTFSKGWTPISLTIEAYIEGLIWFVTLINYMASIMPVHTFTDDTCKSLQILLALEMPWSGLIWSFQGFSEPGTGP